MFSLITAKVVQGPMKTQWNTDFAYEIDWFLPKVAWAPYTLAVIKENIWILRPNLLQYEDLELL